MKQTSAKSTAKATSTVKGARNPRQKNWTFKCDVAPGAGEVLLAGDFTNWDPVPMAREKDGFRASLPLTPGEHRYKFLVDGVWQNDPAAAENVPNSFGTMDSVVRVD